MLTCFEVLSHRYGSPHAHRIFVGTYDECLDFCTGHNEYDILPMCTRGEE